MPLPGMTMTQFWKDLRELHVRPSLPPPVFPLPSSLLREVQTVEMCPAIFLSFGRRNWVSNNSCCHAGPTAAKSQRTKVMARGKRSQSVLGTLAQSGQFMVSVYHNFWNCNCIVSTRLRR